jgi:hypothetical protein
MFSPIDNFFDVKILDELQNDLEMQLYPDEFTQEKENLIDFIQLIQALSFVHEINFKKLKDISMHYIVEIKTILSEVNFLNGHSFRTICETLDFIVTRKNDPKNNDVIMVRDYSISVHYLILYIFQHMNALNFKQQKSKLLFSILNSDITLQFDCNIFQGKIRILSNAMSFE